MELKTVQDLRDFLDEREDRELKIGSLTLTLGENKKDVAGDVDIHFEGRLVAYFSNEKTGDTLLATDDLLTVMSEVRDAFDTESSAKKKSREADKLIQEAREQVALAQAAVGKVEAYEKLLIGREITIGR